MSEIVSVSGQNATTETLKASGVGDKPVLDLVSRLVHGDIRDVDLAFGNFVVEAIFCATGHYALRRIIATGWPRPSRDRCGLGKNLYARGVRELQKAGLLTDDRRWLTTHAGADEWLSRRDVSSQLQELWLDCTHGKGASGNTTMRQEGLQPDSGAD